MAKKKTALAAAIIAAALLSPSVGRCLSNYTDLKSLGADSSGKTDVSAILNRAMKDTAKPGTVYLPEGKYLVATTIAVPSDMEIKGSGPNSILLMPKVFGGRAFITNEDHQGGNKNITLDSLAIVMNISGMRGDSPGLLRFENVDTLKIENLSVDAGSRLYAVDLASCVRNASVDNSNIKNSGPGGCIMARNGNPGGLCPSYNIKIENNKVSSGVLDEPIAVFGWLGVLKDVRIAGNQVGAAGASFGITAYGTGKPADTGQLSGVEITGNTVTGGNNGGIAVMGGAASVNVSGNHISNTKNDGIFIHAGGKGLPSPQDVKVDGNDVSDAGRHGIYAFGAGVEISGNHIKNCGNAGIFAAGETQAGPNVIEGCLPAVFYARHTNKK